MIVFKIPWLGIAIPCFLISFIAYGSHYFILLNFLSFRKQLWFELSVLMIWISYYLAIYTNPGKPTSDFLPSRFNWNNYCHKCTIYKPERAHHCKVCDQCVLVMDHHCPWTMNCVGYKNFPHFMRFLFWIILTTGFLLVQLCGRLKFIWVHKDIPSYLFCTREIVFLMILTPLDAFILVTISLLYIRCVKNQCVKGMSQIESWEMDRLKNMFYRGKLLPKLLKNLEELYPSILNIQDADIKIFLSRKNLSIDEVINFPYDIDLWNNLVNTLGNPWGWLLPFGSPNGDGMHFSKNELSIYEDNLSIEDQLLSLPWPPDGGHQKLYDKSSEYSLGISNSQGESVLRNRSVDRQIPIAITEWYNDWGETLADFGVDLDAESGH